MTLKTSNRRNPNFILSDGKLITNRRSNADVFNNYFNNIDPSLSKQVPKTNSFFSDFLINQSLNFLFLEETDEVEIEKII